MATENKNIDISGNILKTITMLEKALERKARQCFVSPIQYPSQYHAIMAALRTLRLW